MGIDWASDNPVGIRIAAAGMRDKLAPVGHNLDGVDVPVGVGLGMVDIPSMVVVDTVAANTVCCFVHSCSEEGMAHFEQVAHEVDVCFVPVDSEECYYVPVDCFVEEVHFGECFGFVGEWEVASRSVQVCSAGEHEFVVAPR